MIGVLKKILFWNYARTSWQWDALCVVILIFIFLTPKSWFSVSERQLNGRHQTPVASTLYIGAEVIDNGTDMSGIQERVRALTGRPEAQVIEVRKRTGQDGKTIGYEVDIR